MASRTHRPRCFYCAMPNRLSKTWRECIKKIWEVDPLLYPNCGGEMKNSNSSVLIVLGNFELRFTVEQPFSFPGGGLIIRFSNPSAAYAADTTPTYNLVGGASTSDASGYFAGRFWADSNGVSPWDASNTDHIGGFQITTQNVSVPTMNEWGMVIFCSSGRHRGSLFFEKTEGKSLKYLS
jgi:hypothetical protein